jgi:hypothetical protein
MIFIQSKDPGVLVEVTVASIQANPYSNPSVHFIASRQADIKSLQLSQGKQDISTLPLFDPADIPNIQSLGIGSNFCNN